MSPFAIFIYGRKFLLPSFPPHHALSVGSFDSGCLFFSTWPHLRHLHDRYKHRKAILSITVFRVKISPLRGRISKQIIYIGVIYYLYYLCHCTRIRDRQTCLLFSSTRFNKPSFAKTANADNLHSPRETREKSNTHFKPSADSDQNVRQ